MDNVTMAKINLFAVLRNIEDLCVMDPVSKDLIKDVDLGVEFNVPEVGAAVLTFKGGKCTFTRGKGKSALKLYFTSPEHFNNLIAPPVNPKTGEPKMVIPIFYNVFKVKFLLDTFTKLADRLSYYLQPKPEKKDELLKDPAYFETNTILTAYTAFYAMSEIANSDYIGQEIAKRMPEGVIACEVGGTDLAMNITVKTHPFVTDKGETLKKNIFVTNKGKVAQPRATMVFGDLQFAHDLLNGKTSSFTGMGTGQFQVYGFVEMLEQMAKLLSQVSIYLK